MRPVVNTKKHVVQFSLFTVASGAIANLSIIDAVAAPDAAVAAEVREGSKISAVYIEMWIQTDDATLGSSIVICEKVPGAGNTPATAAEIASLNSYDNKKNVFYTQMGLTPNSTQFPMASVKGWFKIPKSKQRFGLEDRFLLDILAQSNGLSACGFAIYKEQY